MSLITGVHPAHQWPALSASRFPGAAGDDRFEVIVIAPGPASGVDRNYRFSNNLIDEGQFGAPQYGTRRTILAGVAQCF